MTARQPTSEVLRRGVRGEPDPVVLNEFIETPVVVVRREAVSERSRER